MSESDKHKIDLGQLFRLAGYNLPIHESEVEEFEKNLEEADDSKPMDWDNPLQILKRGKVESIDVSKFRDVDEESAKRLSMAAREGKGISDQVRKKMNEDRNRSK